MLSPVMTVVVLAVLWLIVVVPMLVRHGDERRKDRAVAGFGRMMRALGRRPSESRSDVFTPHDHDDAAPADSAGNLSVARPDRRPVPAPQEALMYPVDHSEISAARAQMMARRQRSLVTLGGGTVLFVVLAVLFGGLMWAPAAGFVLGLLGYLYFLRSQAQRDRDRRVGRLERATMHRYGGYEVTSEEQRDTREPESLVHIDDDDVELQSMETMDLTGLYVEADFEDSEVVTERRAS